MNLLIFCGFLLLAPTIAEANPSFKVDKIEKGQIQFATPEDGSPKPKDLKTKLFDLVLVGVIGTSESKTPPFLLLEGSDCENCEQDRFLYLIRADGDGEPLRLVYPGKVTDRKTGETVMISRSFYGACVPGKKEGYVAFLQEKLKRRRYLQSSVFIAEIVDGHIEEQLIIRRPPNVQNTLTRAKRKECFEVPGRNRKSQVYNISRPPEKDEEKETQN